MLGLLLFVTIICPLGSKAAISPCKTSIESKGVNLPKKYLVTDTISHCIWEIAQCSKKKENDHFYINSSGVCGKGGRRETKKKRERKREKERKGKKIITAHCNA